MPDLRATLQHIAARPVPAFARRVASRQMDQQLATTAAGMAFWLMISLVPAFMASVMTLSLLTGPDTVRSLLSVFDTSEPDAISTVLVDQVRTTSARLPDSVSLAFLLSLLALLWTASSGYLHFSRGARQAYGLPAHPLVSARARALGGGLLAVCVLAAATSMVAVTVRATAGTSGAARWLTGVAGVLIDAGLLAAVVAGLLRLATGTRSHTVIWPGSIFAAVAISAISIAYGDLMVREASFQSTYGTLTAVIVVMLIFYFSCLATLVGAAINAEWPSARQRT